MKKFISFALAASMALSMVPATAFAASDLTASHSNIRVTANTEFYPKKVADADASLTTREVPYILLEATTDFKYDEQTFELALENAEWLERKDDGDILFVETDEYMTGEDGVKFKPAGSTSTDTTTPPSTTEQIGELQRAYESAAKALKKAGDAYVDKLTAEMTTAQAAMDSAAAALKTAQTEEETAKKDYDTAEEQSKNIEQLVAEYEAAWDAYKALGDGNGSAGSAPDSSALAPNGDPDEVPDPFTTANGLYKVDNGKYVYWEDGNATCATPANITSAELAIAELGTATLGGTQYDTDKAAWKTYNTEKDLYDATVADILTKKAAIEAAAKKINDAGGKASITDKNVDVSGVENAVAELLEAYETAKAATATAQRAYDKAKAAYDKATASIATERTAFDAALKARNEAGNKLVSVAGQGEGVNFIDDVDQSADVGFASDETTYDGFFGTAPNTVAVTTLGIKDITLSGVVAGAYDVAVGTETLKVEITKKSDSRVVVKTSGYRFKDGDVLSIPLFVRTTGGTASVSIDSLDSEFTSQGKTFAKTADGDTELSIEKVQNFYDDDEIKNLYLEELVAGTIEPGKIISLRIIGDFKMIAD